MVTDIISILVILLPVWLILRDNNVHLGAIPVTIIIVWAILTGMGHYLMSKRKAERAEWETLQQLRITDSLKELKESQEKIEKLLKELVHAERET